MIRVMLWMTILIGFTMLSCKNQNETSDSTDIETRYADSLSGKEISKIAWDHYRNIENEKAIAAFKASASRLLKENDPKSAAIAYLNTSNLYDEGLDDYESALTFAHKSLDIWNAQKNNLQAANLYKYIGYLEGHLGDHDKGLANIQMAATMYSQLNNRDGIAVCNFNSAKVYYLKNDFENAVSAIQEANAHWRTKENGSRIFTNNNLLLEIYHASNQQDMLMEVLKESKELKTSVRINNTALSHHNDLLKKLELE